MANKYQLYRHSTKKLYLKIIYEALIFYLHTLPKKKQKKLLDKINYFYFLAIKIIQVFYNIKIFK